MPDNRSETVTLKIPRPLYNRLSQLIEGTGFRSVTEFAIYVLRDLAAQSGAERHGEGPRPAGQMTEKELDAARERLRELGYL
jgi:hypothetical protein